MASLLFFTFTQLLGIGFALSAHTNDILHIPYSPDVQSLSMAMAQLDTKTPMHELSVCSWVKSVNTEHTGTIFTINNKQSQQIEFGLVQFENYELYVVVQGVKSESSIVLNIGDIRWHHVCVTWSNLAGNWGVFLDGNSVSKGSKLNIGAVISQQLEINFAGYSTNERIQQFAGKMTEMYTWDRAILPLYVHKMYNCKSEFRQNMGRQLRGENVDSDLSKSIAWMGKARSYTWNPTNIEIGYMSSFRQNENICNDNVIVECETNRMFISILKSIVTGLNIDSDRLHLEGTECKPLIRGERNGSIVFELDQLNSCGNKIQTTQRDVVYRNTVSNTPTTPLRVYIGHLFKMNVECRYPINIKVTMDSKENKDMSLMAKTKLQNPVTKKKSLEAVSMLFSDETFAHVDNKNKISMTKDKIFVGIAIEENKSKQEESSANDDAIKLIADGCWLISERKSVSLFEKQGCSISQSSGFVSVIENGITSQTRFQLSPLLLANNQPTYIKCAVRSCIGQNCIETCNNGSPNVLRNRQKRDANQPAVKGDLSYISIGPIYRNNTWLNDQFKFIENFQEADVSQDKTISIFGHSISIPLLAAIAALIFVTIVTCTLLLYFLCCRQRTMSHDSDDESCNKGKLRPRSASIGSLGSMTLSSSFPSTLSIDLYGEDSSYSSSLDIPYVVNLETY